MQKNQTKIAVALQDSLCHVKNENYKNVVKTIMKKYHEY
jgi:hypothetical protein